MHRRDFLGALIVGPSLTVAATGDIDGDVQKDIVLSKYIATYQFDTFERGHHHKDRAFLLTQTTDEEALKYAILYERYAILDDFYCWAILKSLIKINTAPLEISPIDFDRNEAFEKYGRDKDKLLKNREELIAKQGLDEAEVNRIRKLENELRGFTRIESNYSLPDLIKMLTV